MAFPNLLKWKYSSVIIVGTGVLLFWAGYRLGLIRDGDLDSREEQLYAFILTVTIPVGIAFSNAIVNREIQEESEGEIEKAQKERDKAIEKSQLEVGKLQVLYTKKLDNIKEKLEPLKEFEDLYQQFIAEIESCQATFEELKERSRVASDITSWLSSKANRMNIRDYAVAAAEKEVTIPPHQMPIFRNDIGRCINWLRDSIFVLQGYEVRRSDLARASQDIPGELKAYLAALEAIKSHPDLTRISKKTNILEDFIQELSEKL